MSGVPLCILGPISSPLGISLISPCIIKSIFSPFLTVSQPKGFSITNPEPLFTYQIVGWATSTWDPLWSILGLNTFPPIFFYTVSKAKCFANLHLELCSISKYMRFICQHLSYNFTYFGLKSHLPDWLKLLFSSFFTVSKVTCFANLHSEPSFLFYNVRCTLGHLWPNLGPSECKSHHIQ